MHEEQQNDQIIGTAFKWSVIVLAALGVLGLAASLVYKNMQDVPELEETATAITPQVLSQTTARAAPDVKFTDITQDAGLRHSHFSGAYGERLLPETMGGGVAVFDFDNDSIADLLFVNSTTWPWRQQTTASSLAVYKGTGAGQFEEVTEQLGLDQKLFGMGVAVGDYDDDGYTDILVTAVGENRLYKNLLGEKFEDVTHTANVAGDPESWSTGAAFFDHDKDGDLDLMVLNYVTWSREIDLQADYQLTGIGRAYGPPSQFAGTDSYFYENLGDGRFRDISRQAGIQVENSATGQAVGKGLGLLPTDINSDGWTDIIVANDTVRNFLFLNNTQGGFKEVGVESGLAFDNTGSATGAMGIDGGALSNAGEYAVAIGNFGNEMTSLYVSANESGMFTDQAVVTGIGPDSRRAVTFGLLFFDYDLDGRLDLVQANGHIEPDINVVEPSQRYAQPVQLFWNCGPGCPRQFVPVATSALADLSTPMVGRALAATDIDLDGDLDLLLTQIDGPSKLIRNDQQLGNNWLQLDLRLANGAVAVGAKVQLESDQLKESELVSNAVVNPTKSYLTQNDPVLTFGLGNIEKVEGIQILWPNGDSQVLISPSLNQRHRIQQVEPVSNSNEETKD